MKSETPENNTLPSIQGLIDHLNHPIVVRAEKGFGSFLTIDLVESSKEYSGDTTRDLGLWVYMTEWCLCQNGKELLNCEETDDEKYEAVLIKLLTKSLTSINETIIRQEILITFDDGITLHLKKNTDEYEAEDDLLIVYYEHDKVMAYSPEHRFYDTK